MLARASSDAGTRLRRSKSASSAHRQPPPILEPFDLSAAKQQALAAATAAYARAQAQDALDQETKRSLEVSRSKSNASRKSTTMQGQGSHFPARGSSFRASKNQNPAQSTIPQRPSRAATMKTEEFPPFHPTSSIDRPASAPRPLSAQPSIAFSEHSRSSTQHKNWRSGASSSITSQQIRKARSMYYASSVQTGSPIARPPTMHLATSSAAQPSPTTTTPPACPPSRKTAVSPLAEPRIPVVVAADESVDKARDAYLQTFQQRSVKHKPSLFLAPFIKRQDKGKDKSKRISSSLANVPPNTRQTPDDSTVDFTLTDFMPEGDKKDKRSFSGSLKSKIKRVFRRSSRPSPRLPVQQIEASREYFGSDPVEIHDSDQLYAIPSPEDAMLERVRARTPSLDPIRPAFARSGSRASSNGSALSNCSNRSLHSEVHATNPSVSRVTSWGTTSTADTLAQRAIKRLTVIHESKDSIGSEADRISSLSTKRKSLPSGALAAFREPMPMESLMEESSTPVDPKRVFSALMKEIETSKAAESASRSPERTPGAESDIFESSKTKILHAGSQEIHSLTARDSRSHTSHDEGQPAARAPSAVAHITQGKTSSIRTLGRAIRSTIRSVSPAEPRSFPCPEQPTTVRGTVRIPGDDVEISSGATTPDPEDDCINIDTRLSLHRQRPQAFSPSPAQIEKRVAKAKDRWKTPLDDVQQLQFPRETNRTYSTTTFAQHTESQHQHEPAVQTQLGPSETRTTEPPASPPPRATMSPLSPSVYSRNTDGVSILPNDSVMSFNLQNEFERHHDGGSAVILTSQSVRSYVVGTPSPRRSDSARSSRDWKAWLSHEVSSMGLTSQEDLKIHEQYFTSSGEHKAETIGSSYTEEDDTTVILRPSCDTVILKPAQDTQTNVLNSTEVVETEVFKFPNVEFERTSDSPVLERSQSHTDTFKEVTPDNTPPIIEPSSRRLSRPRSVAVMSQQRPPLARSHRSSGSQPMVETPTSARMNDRFPFINTGRRSSSNSARSSRLSRSPPDSVTSSTGSSKAKPSPRIYTDLSAPSNEPLQRTPVTHLRSDEVAQDVKENVTPPSLRANKGNVTPQMSRLGITSRAKSLQPLSSTTLNRSTANIGQYTSNIPETKHSKHLSSPAATPPRPRIRAIVRPISPDKLSRRPKSAFDLRGTSRTALPRPTSELRRPALHLKTSSSSLAMTKEPSPGAEQRSIDSIFEDGERSGSITPGQRMADTFLRERKSTGLLPDSGKLRGHMKLIREDTPAFL